MLFCFNSVEKLGSTVKKLMGGIYFAWHVIRLSYIMVYLTYFFDRWVTRFVTIFTMWSTIICSVFWLDLIIFLFSLVCTGSSFDLGLFSANIFSIYVNNFAHSGFLWGDVVKLWDVVKSFLYWHLLHSTLSWGIKSQGNSTTERRKNLCKWDDSRGGVLSICPGCYPKEP